jgi:hypothetical protein
MDFHNYDQLCSRFLKKTEKSMIKEKKAMRNSNKTSEIQMQN